MWRGAFWEIHTRNMDQIFGKNGSETPEPVKAQVTGETLSLYQQVLGFLLDRALSSRARHILFTLFSFFLIYFAGIFICM